MYKKKTKIYTKSKMPGQGLGIILFQIEPISRLRQLVSIEINQGISSLFQDIFNNKRAIPHVFELSSPQGILVLGINQNKVTFRETLGLTTLFY